MDDEKGLLQAKKTFATMCEALDDFKWHYEKNEEDLSINCKAQGDDLPMDIRVQVDAERQLVLLLSLLPFVTPEERRVEMAVAVSNANNLIVDGSFDFDVMSGRMLFRMTNSFLESELGKDVFAYLILCSCKTIDDFNDKFLMLSRGMMSLDQFMKLHS